MIQFLIGMIIGGVAGVAMMSLFRIGGDDDE